MGPVPGEEGKTGAHLSGLRGHRDTLPKTLNGVEGGTTCDLPVKGAKGRREGMKVKWGYGRKEENKKGRCRGKKEKGHGKEGRE